MRFTAPQVVNRFLEVFGDANAARRSKNLGECFGPAGTLSNLMSGAEVVRGGAAVTKALAASAAKRIEPLARLFIEKAGGSRSDFALDVYSSPPALTGLGVRNAGPDDATMVLYRVTNNTIDKVWATSDADGLTELPRVTEAALRASMCWDDIAEALDGAWGKAAALETHFNDYRDAETIG